MNTQNWIVSDIDEKGGRETVRDMQKLGGEVRLTADSSVDRVRDLSSSDNAFWIPGVFR